VYLDGAAVRGEDEGVDPMPKMKTKRGAAKRFKVTGSGKVRRARGYRRHILTTKSRKRKRQLRRAGLVAPANERAVKALIPYL
jgi:large subunit ribosomal protein L35